MRTAEDLNRWIEEETGIPDALCRTREPMPLFGHKHLGDLSDRLTALLRAEGVVDLAQLDVRCAIDFLMPSTTEFARIGIGERVAQLVESPDPKIVAIGCSTGLEVYWIAHFLKRAGLLTEQGKIQGIDINQSALEIARMGQYPYDKEYLDQCLRHSPAGAEEALLIDETEKTVRFKDELKPHVHFSYGNLMKLESLTSLGLEGADIVVVMNVLKYMSPVAQQKALNHVAKILREGGIFIYLDQLARRAFREHDAFQPIEGLRYAFKKAGY